MNAQKKSEKLEWTSIMQEKFEKLKELFKRNPIRSYPRYDIASKFILTTDYSKENLGAILSQDQDGKERMNFIIKYLRDLRKIRQRMQNTQELSSIFWAPIATFSQTVQNCMGK